VGSGDLDGCHGVRCNAGIVGGPTVGQEAGGNRLVSVCRCCDGLFASHDCRLGGRGFGSRRHVTGRRSGVGNSVVLCRDLRL
jgi:hypothetical protein